MSKFLFFLLFSVSLFSEEFKDWDYTHVFTLKKDEVAKIEVIKKEYESQPKPEGDFSFRWTLYHNKLLVLLTNYEEHKMQYVLQKLYKRDAIALNLLGDYDSLDKRVILKLKFVEFSKDRATIEAMIYDPNKRIEVEFIEPKRKR